jgi:hypothetical protein
LPVLLIFAVFYQFVFVAPVSASELLTCSESAAGKAQRGESTGRLPEIESFQTKANQQ